MKINIGKFLLDAGKGLIKDLPGGNIAMAAINAFLPDGEKIHDNVSADQALDTINSLPAEQKAECFKKELDVEIAESNNFAAVQEAMSKADATGNTGRPFIAKIMAWIIAVGEGIFFWFLAEAMLNGTPEKIIAISNLWPLVSGALGVPATVILQYFGKRTKEKKERYKVAAASMGQPQINTIQQIVGMFKK